MKETCRCIEVLAEDGFIQSNLLKSGQYFLYPIIKDKVGKTPILVRYCPICGKELE